MVKLNHGDQMERQDYTARLLEAKEKVIKVLTDKGIDTRYLVFGGEGSKPQKLPRVPTDAQSEFLANRAMGDWAENILSNAIRAAVPNWIVSQYGNTDEIAAGEEGFAEVYRSGLEEVRLHGKRPDLLILPASENCPLDLSAYARDASDVFVKKAHAAIEVRSSKFLAKTYMQVRQDDLDAGKKSDRPTPSFTVKVEDLVIVYRWLERYGVPQAYCQVFFDCVYGINVLKIFEIIGSGQGFKIETPAASQMKATIMIPITAGYKIGDFSAPPQFVVETRQTRLGRVDSYVRPVGGSLMLDASALKTVLLAQ